MNSHEVFFENKAADITLAGTLTIPQSQKPAPAVLLIPGMGPADRDCTLPGGNHKLFLVFADYLTQHGIAVLRYDKRGVGKSTGKFDLTVTTQDLAGDVLAGVEYLKTCTKINAKQIGLIGHSEGGIIASIIASQSKDIAFAVLLAPAVATGTEEVLDLVALQLQADGATQDLITRYRFARKQLMDLAKQEPDPVKAEGQMHGVFENYWRTLSESQKSESEKLLFAICSTNANDTIAMINSPWSRYYLACDTSALFKRITVPVLTLMGELDFIAFPKIIAPIVEHGFKQASNTDHTIVEFPKLNHWFQECKTGALAEYGATKETIAPAVLKTISEWIVARVK